MFATAVVLIMLVIYTIFLLGVLSGWLWLPFTLEATLSKIVPGIAASFFTFSVLSMRELCSGAVVGWPYFKVQPVDQEVTNLMATPVALFSALLIQGVLQVMSSANSQTLLVTPALVVHVVATLFYTWQAFAPSPCELQCCWPLARAGINPLHSALWMSSVSSQVMTLYGLSQSLQSAPSTTTLVAVTGQRRACFALLCVSTMLITGALADGYLRDERVSIAMAFVSFVAFYALLFTGIYLPLVDCYSHAVLSDNPWRKKSATSYRAVCAYLVLAWHGFPLVWTANVLGKATRTQIEIGYIICDVLAKFLPPSLYLTVATSRTR